MIIENDSRCDCSLVVLLAVADGRSLEYNIAIAEADITSENELSLSAG
jgi:hypothetical protein